MHKQAKVLISYIPLGVAPSYPISKVMDKFMYFLLILVIPMARNLGQEYRYGMNKSILLLGLMLTQSMDVFSKVWTLPELTERARTTSFNYNQFCFGLKYCNDICRNIKLIFYTFAINRTCNWFYIPQ
jgi:hypothetical protein